MSVAYVCDQCEAELTAGMTACPQCGEVFDTPVPALSQPGEPLIAVSTDPHPVPLPSLPPPDHIGRTVGLGIALILLGCLFWLGHNGAFRPGGGYLPAPFSHVIGR